MVGPVGLEPTTNGIMSGLDATTMHHYIHTIQILVNIAATTKLHKTTTPSTLGRHFFVPIYMTMDWRQKQ